MIQFQARTPRWIVVLIDLSIAFFSLGLSYLIRFDLNANFEVLHDEWNQTSWSIFFYFAIKFIVYFIFGIHKGLIRHTSMQDLKRIFKANATCSLLFLLIGLIRAFGFQSSYMFPNSILIMEFLFSLIFVLGSRFAIKLLYLESIKSSHEKENVLIYGAGTMGLIAKNTIENDTRNHQKIVGFLDNNTKLFGNRINGIPVYDVSKIESLNTDKPIDRVIIAIRNPEKMLLQSFIEKCLAMHIKVQRVPDPKTWVNGELTPQRITKIPIEDLLGRESIRLNQAALQNAFSKKTVIVTGAAGSIGNGLVKEIIQYAPSRLVLLDQAESPLYDLQQEIRGLNPSISLEFIVADVCEKSRVFEIFNEFHPHIVFHAAAYKHVPLMEENPKEAIKTNVFGTKNIMDAAISHNAESFVFISTDKAVNPTNIMGASKRIAELMIQSNINIQQPRFITTRFGNVLGSNGSVIPLFQKQIEEGGPITLTDENITRYFMTIPEACQLVLEAFNMGNGGEIYVFDMGESVKIIDLAKKMILLNGLEIDKDIQIKITGLRPGEKLYEELLANSDITMATHHPKILIAQTEMIDQDFNTLLNTLNDSLSNVDNEFMVKTMKLIVPEYISKNSTFESLDA